MKKGPRTQSRVCPCCGARVKLGLAQSYWGKAASMVRRGEQVRVELECCGAKIGLTKVKLLRWGDRDAASAWGRELSAARENCVAGPGRPSVKKLCPKGCGQEYSAREMRRHVPRCTGPGQ